MFYKDQSPTLCTTHYGAPVIAYEERDGSTGGDCGSSDTEDRGGEIAFTIQSRDHKGEMVVVISEQDGDIEPGGASGKLQRTRCI